MKALFLKLKPLLLKYWQYVLIVLLIVALSLAIRGCKNKSEELQIEKSSKDSTYQEAVMIKQKNGELVFRVKSIEATAKQLRETNAILWADKKQLSAQNIKLNSLLTFYKGKFTLDETFSVKGVDTVLRLVASTDTVNTRAKTFHWSNKWLTLDEFYNPSTDSLTHHYRYAVEFKLLTYRQGQNFFRRGELVSDIKFSDPHIKVGEFHGVVVVEPKKPWYETGGAKFVIGALFGWLAHH